MNRHQRRHSVPAPPPASVRVDMPIPMFSRELGLCCDLCRGPVTEEYPYLCKRCITFLANAQIEAQGK
jgi:hypothetical protein